MSNNIRKITLYKNQIPMRSSEASYQYFTFGHFSGMDIETITSNNKYGELDTIFNERMHVSDKLKSNFNVQVCYCFRDETEDMKMFWDETERYKFIIVSFLHIVGTNFQALKARNVIDQLLNNEEELTAYTYSTFNNCDFIIFTCTNEYKKAIQVLMSLDGKEIENSMMKINYSYTVLAVPNSILEYNLEDINMYNDIIPSMTFRFMAKDINKLNLFLDTIDLFKNKKKMIMGSDDFVVHLDNIVLRDILALFSRNGALHLGNEIYIEAVNAINTHIEFDYLEITQKQKSLEADVISWVDDQMNLLLNLYKKSTSINLSQKECFNSALQILHNLKQYERTTIGDYAYACITYPLKMYIQRIRSTLTRKILNDINVIDLYEALDCMNFILQSTSSSYIQAFKRPVYTTALYDVSGKLLSFYSGLTFFLTYMLRGFDNQRSYHYAFLLNVKLQHVMSVKIVFEDQNPCDRLLLVNMPIYQLYNPKNLVLTLAHEVSHIVGEDTRLRKLRKESIISATLNYIQNYILEDLIEEVELKEYIEEMTKEFSDALKICIKQSLNIVESEMEHVSLSDYSEHFTSNLYKAANRAIFENMEDLIESFIFPYQKEIISKNNLDQFSNRESFEKMMELQNDLQKIEDNIRTKLYLIFSESDYNLASVISIEKDYYREFYADLVAIYLLNPELEDYICNFRFNEQGSKDIIADDRQVILRIACIYNVYYKDQKKFEDIHLDSSYSKILESVGDLLRKNGNQYNVIQSLFNLLSEYLSSCLAELRTKGEQHSELLSDFRRIYKICERHSNKENSLSELFETINFVNNKYYAYNKAALLYYFELGDLGREIATKFLEEGNKEKTYLVSLKDRNIKYVPLDGECYCVIDSSNIMKVKITQLDYSNKTERKFSFSVLRMCNESECCRIMKLKIMQEELEKCTFKLSESN